MKIKNQNFKITLVSLLVSAAVGSVCFAAAEIPNATSSPVNTAILDFSSIDDFSQPINLTTQFTDKNVFNLGSGTLTFRIRPNAGFSNLLGVSDSSSDVRYIAFYVNVKNGKEQYGVEIRDGHNTRLIPNSELVTGPLSPSENGFRTITYSFDKQAQSIKIYVDGQLQKSTNQSKFFEDISGLDLATLGQLTRHSPNYPTNKFSGSIYHAGATDEVLSETAIQRLHEDIVARHSIDLAKQAEKLASLAQKRSAMGAFMSEKYEIFKPHQAGANNYRIPGLLALDSGVVIAAIDKRNQHASDWGNIDLAIRRSLDGGITWQDDQLVVDLAEQTYPSLGAAESALVIDAVMVQNRNDKRVTLVFDMFPESQALFGMFSNSQASFESEGNGHIQVDGKWYRLITDVDGNRYTVREGGVVYNRLGEAQDFRIVTEGDPAIAFKNLGDIIQISTNERKGNIFLRSRKTGHDSGPFNAHYTTYLWMTYSDDNGATWASPVDITTQVKADWMRFLGTGPGTGIQLKDGTLMIPVYYTNRDNKQSSAVIMSKDGGKTWTRGDSPNDAYLDEIGGSRYLNTTDYEITESQVVEMNNGDIKMFSRNRSGAVIISTSHDGGMTWDKGMRLKETALLDPYSQMSVIHYSKLINGKEYLVFANPHANGARRNGMAWLGEVQEDGSIQWKYNTVIDPGTYSYNSLTELPNGDIGLLYEQRQGDNVQYVRFNLQELLWKDNLIYRDSRNDSNPNVSFNSLEEETFYKIGDGEMVKVGEGANPAKLVVEEGIATLSQTPDAQGNVQAYSDVQVNSQGTLRVGNDYSQVPLENLHLNGGTLDVNGHYFIIDHHNNREGLRAENINGNIINTKDDVTLEYQVGGNTTLNGKLGDIESRGVLNFNYAPESANSELRLTGDSTLGTLNVQKGTLVLAPKTNHLAETTHIEPNGTLRLEDSVLNTKLTEIAPNANLIAKVSAQNVAALFSERVIGDGNLIKQGEGVLLLDGEIAHRGKTDIQQGSVWLNGGSLSGSEVILGAGTQLAGSGKINAKTQWSLGSRIAPSLYENLDVSQERAANVFSPQTLSFTDVENLGAEVELRVNNHHDDLTQWTHDRLVIEGDLKTQSAVPVDVVLLGDRQGKSDRNHNGAYDANEGLSLIRVYGEGALSQFVLRQAQDLSHSPYDLSLVSVDKGIAGNYYDYQLHNTLIDANGNAVTPIIKASVSNPQVEPTPQVTPSPQVEPTPQVAPSPQVEPTPQVMPNPQVAPIPQVTPTPPARAKLKAQVPSYLVATNAMLSQGNALRDRFLDNAYAKEKQGFYVLQQYDKRRYESDLSFSNYGYDFDSKQHSTLFGGYIPLTAQTELHGGIGFSRQKVTPKAADGVSETRYKTTSLLFALQHKWDNWRLSGGVGVHFHRGDVSAAGASGKIKGTQYQVDTELGYQIGDEQFRITPTVGLSYQQLHVNIDDRSMSSLSIEQDKRRVLTPSLGAYAEWNQARFQWKLGAFYEHNQDSGKDLYVGAERFLTGKLGNAVVVKASGDIALTPQLSFGVQLNHRHGVSNAKLKQTEVAGKLEYRF